jgi:hypothetical protein
VVKNETNQGISQINLTKVSFNAYECQTKLKIYQLKLQGGSAQKSQLLETL